MAASHDIEEASSGTGKGSSKQRNHYDSTYKSDGSRSNSNSKTASIAVPIDPSVLEMVSAVRDEHDSDEYSQQRKSQLFCFVCCDLVKACIIMNAVHIVISIFHILISVFQAPISFRIDLYEVTDDDEIGTLSPWGVVGWIKVAFGFLFSIVAMVGAHKFSKKMILAAVIWDCCYTLLSLINLQWSLFFLSIPFLYVDLHLLLVLRSGSITRENYETEKHCCFGGNHGSE